MPTKQLAIQFNSRGGSEMFKMFAHIGSNKIHKKSILSWVFKSHIYISLIFPEIMEEHCEFMNIIYSGFARITRKCFLHLIQGGNGPSFII